MTVDFGWMLPTGTQRMPDGSYPAHLLEMLAHIEAAFSSFWIPDHLMDGDAPIPEALTMLAYLAGQQPGMRFGTCVLSASYRNPALLAKTAATLQMLSGGRFVLGVGAGWKADEYTAYGYDFPPTPARIAAMGETIQICKALWAAGGAPVTFTGDHHHIAGATCVPSPGPPPPVMVGGVGEKLTLRVVAEHADWWNIPGAPLDVVARKSQVLAGHCADVGRDPASIRRTWMGVVSIAETRAEAERRLAGFPIWKGDRALVGSVGEVVEQVRAYVAAGVSLFILSFTDEPGADGLRRFARSVIPEFNRG